MEKRPGGLKRWLDDLPVAAKTVNRLILLRAIIEEWGNRVASGEMKYNDIQAKVSKMTREEKDDLYFFLYGLSCGLGMLSHLRLDPENTEFFFILGKLDAL